MRSVIIALLVVITAVVAGLSFTAKSNNTSIVNGVGFIPIEYYSRFHTMKVIREDDTGLFHKVIINFRVPSSGETLFNNILLLVNTNPYPVMVTVTVHNRRVNGITKFSLILTDKFGYRRDVNIVGNNRVFLYIPPETSESISFLVKTKNYNGNYNFTISFYFTR